MFSAIGGERGKFTAGNETSNGGKDCLYPAPSPMKEGSAEENSLLLKESRPSPGPFK